MGNKIHMCHCVCLSPAGIYWYVCRDRAGFLTYRLHSTYPTLCFRLSPKIRVLPSGTLSKTRDQIWHWHVHRRHQCDTKATVVGLLLTTFGDVVQDQMFSTADRRQSTVTCWSHSASRFVYSAMSHWAWRSVAPVHLRQLRLLFWTNNGVGTWRRKVIADRPTNCPLGILSRMTSG